MRVDDFIYYLLFIIYLLFTYSFVRRTLLFHQKRGGTTERFQTEFKANKQRTTTNKQGNRQQQQQQQTTATNNKQTKKKMSSNELKAGLAVAQTVERDYGNCAKLRRVDVLIERLRNKGIALNNEEMRECIQSLN